MRDSDDFEYFEWQNETSDEWPPAPGPYPDIDFEFTDPEDFEYDEYDFEEDYEEPPLWPGGAADAACQDF